MYKGLTLIINSHLQQILALHNIIPQEQCGFNKAQDTLSAIVTYLETIKTSTHHKLPLHVVYIDFKAAFDSVQHWTITQILQHLQINPITTHFITNIMTHCYTSIQTQTSQTKKIPLNNGVKQGDPLSSTLFLIYLLPLQWLLNKTQQKTVTNINHLCYADNLLLLSHSRQNIESLLGQTALYTYYTDMSINSYKSAYSYMNSPPQTPLSIALQHNQTLTQINIDHIPSSKSYKYLGLNINLNLDFTDTFTLMHKKYKDTISHIITKRYLGINLLIKLINTVAVPKIAYSMNFIE